MTRTAPEIIEPEEAPAEARDATPARLQHQPALDGLRGLAIIAVMLYHLGSAGVVWAPGGFIGVDLFFVLSGFLITSLLLIEHGQGRGIVTADFWRRRARRLLPPVFVLLLLVAAYAAVYGKPYELDDFRMGSIATLFYFQNYWQIYGHSAVRSPLAETWSLSIEEQYYLVWPFVLFAIVWATRGRLSRLVTTVCVLAVASAVLMSVRYTSRNPFLVYNATQTRVQALLLGAALGAVLLRWKGPASRAAAITLEVAGFACLAWLVFLTATMDFAPAWMFHGGFFLVALASAVMITAAVQPTSRAFRAVLSWRVLIGIGLISYGLYLYHIAVYLALDPTRVGFSGVKLVVLRLAAVGVIAVASYFWVERPIRSRSVSKRQRWLLGPIGIAVTLALLFAATSGAEPLPATAGVSYAYYRQATGDPNAVRVLVIGDALATSLTRASGTSYRGKKILGTSAGTYGCGISPDDVAVGDAVFESSCHDWREPVDLATTAFAPQVGVIVVGPSEVFDRVVDGKYLRFGTKELEVHLRAELDRAREALTARGARLLLATVPCMEPTAPGRFTLEQRDRTRVGWLNGIWRTYAHSHKDVQLLELHRFLCPGGTHRKIDGERITTSDGTTLNEAGALATWKYIERAATSKPTPDVDDPKGP